MRYLLNKRTSPLGRTVYLLLAVLVISVGASNAQNQKVRFPSSDMEIAKAIESIEQQTGYVFSYNRGLLDVNSRIAFSQSELPLEEALKQMLSDRKLGYMQHNKYIIVHPDVVEEPAGVAAPEPRTDDVYRKTPADSLNASPLRRPDEIRPQVQEVYALEQPTAPVRPAYSSYYPLRNYSPQGNLPAFALKTNLLYWATLTPNLSVEFGLGPKTSLQLSGSYNPWNRKGTVEDNDKLVHWVVRPEFRYWFCERFNGHFVGANLFYNQFNISGKEIPFVDFKKDYRYEGYAAGLGINYGYQFMLGKRWGIELSAGVGVAYMDYDVFPCTLCSGVIESKTKYYFGPTHASASLVFMIR